MTFPNNGCTWFAGDPTNNCGAGPVAEFTRADGLHELACRRHFNKMLRTFWKPDIHVTVLGGMAPDPYPLGMPISAESYAQFIEDLCANIPESYDGDEAIESIIVRYVRDLESGKGGSVVAEE